MLLFMCGSFNNGVSSSAYTTLNGRVFREKLMGKDLERSNYLFFHALSRHLPGEIEKNHENTHSG
jgi:hypothetical protein